MDYPRMLLLEDDALVRHFVEMALEDMALELLPCATLAEAYAVLEHTPVQIILMDMTLPDGSGLDLLQWMRAHGMACRTLVFSGAADATLRQQLLAQGVWRVLMKPAPVDSLVECVAAALAELPPPAPVAPHSLPSPAETAAGDTVARYFGGDQQRFEAYRQSCLGPLAQDVAEGDLAAQSHDWITLHRVAHKLKSALTLLGQVQAAQTAGTTEAHAALQANPQALAGWAQLRQQVEHFVAQHSTF